MSSKLCFTWEVFSLRAEETLWGLNVALSVSVKATVLWNITLYVAIKGNMRIFLLGDELLLFSPSLLCSGETGGRSRSRPGCGGLAVALQLGASHSIASSSGAVTGSQPHGHGGTRVQTAETAQGQPITRMLIISPFSTDVPAAFTPTQRLVPHPALAAALASLCRVWGFSVFLQQMALFSSVSSLLLLEISLGESVLNEPHWFPSPILHEASWKLVQGRWVGEGAGGGTRVLRGRAEPKWRAGHTCAQIQLGFLLLFLNQQHRPLREAHLEGTRFLQYISGFFNPHWRSEPSHVLDLPLFCQSHPTWGIRTQWRCCSQLHEIMKTRWWQ